MAAKNILFQNVETDLNTKAQWHVDFNGGLVPVLETPKGELFGESSFIMSFAHEAGRNDGLQLVPEDPILALKMRT